MDKHFDIWNKKKQQINAHLLNRNRFFYEREVWWCSLGINIGVEVDGKHEKFERPVLILKKFNGQMIWVLPLTSKEKLGKYYMVISYENGTSWVCLSQIRTISTKRLLRKIGMISKFQFSNILKQVIDILKQSDPAQGCAGSSEAEATSTCTLSESISNSQGNVCDTLKSMNISNLKVTIENPKGSYKQFISDEDFEQKVYPLKGVIYPVDYGSIEGYTGEDGADLDIFVGTGNLFGSITVWRLDVPEETKFFMKLTQSELDQILEVFAPVVVKHELINEEDFINKAELFKNKEK